MKFKYFLGILLILCLCGTAYASDVNTTDACSAQDPVVSDDLISVEETNDYSEVSSDDDILSSGGDVNLTVPDMEFTYGKSDSIDVITEAANITANVINHTEASVTVDGKTVTVAGLNAGNYVLYVTTDDVGYITKTATANITVNKADSSLEDMNPFEFVYGSSGNVSVVYDGATNVTARVVGYDGAEVVVGDHVITVSNLPAGNYTLNVTAVGDNNHNDVSKTVNFTVNKREITFYISNDGFDEVNSVDYDENYCIPALGVYTHDVIVNGGGGGLTPWLTFDTLSNCIIKFNGSADNVILTNGNKFKLKNLTAGTYELYVELNDTNRKGNATFSITINKGYASLEIPEITLVYGESGNVTAITDAAAVMLGKIGPVPYSDDDKSEEYIRVDGKVITVLPGINAGTHNFYFIVDDPNWQSRISCPFKVNIKRLNNSLDNISSSEVKYKDAGAVSIKVNATGILRLRASVAGHDEAVIKIENDTVTVSNLKGGYYTLNVTTIGDINHNDVSGTFDFRVKSYSEPNIQIPEITPGKTASVPINLGNATGNISLIVDGKVINTTSLVNGSTVFVIPELTIGQHIISVVYSGDYNFSSFKFNRTITVPSLAKITGDDLTVFYLDGSDYKVRVFDDYGNPLSGAKVTFKIKGKVVATQITDKDGYASYKVYQTPKTYTIITEANGLKLTKKLKVNQVIKAKKTTVVKKSKKVTKIKITLKGKNAYKNMKLTVKFNGKKYNVKTNDKGIAKFKVTKKMVKKFKKGKKIKYTITYKKDSLNRYIKIK